MEYLTTRQLRSRIYYWKNRNKILHKARIHMAKYRHKNKEICTASKKKYYIKNKEKIRIRRKKFYNDNKIVINKKNLKYYYRNKEKQIASFKKYYYRKGGEIRKKRKEHYQKNKEKTKTINKRWQKNNPEKYREIARMSVTRRIARIHNVIHAFTVNEWIAKKNATQGICPLCHNFVGIEKLTLDHTFPISMAEKGRIYTIDDIEPLCKSCNSSKNAKIL